MNAARRTPPVLQLRDLSLSFGGVRAVRGISFRVEPGEVFAIIGPNGAGKTSVFNLVTRVFDASAGSVHLGATEITRLPRHEVVRHGLARTFQNIELFEGATVLDNLLLGQHRMLTSSVWSRMLNLRSVGAEETSARERVEDVIELLNLAAFRDQRVAGLPYGVRKVIELARALAAEPDILLLDEPASGLNPEETRELAAWIDELRNRLGITIVMVEHDMSLVSAVADRVLAMDQGQALVLGTPAEVQSDPRVVAAYLGT
jgi:branched-chain amino acid transport system ATP-binding protein